MYCFRKEETDFIENTPNNFRRKKLKRLRFIGAIENRFIAKLYVFDQRRVRFYQIIYCFFVIDPCPAYVSVLDYLYMDTIHRYIYMQTIYCAFII